jgi:hypothetical protein
MAFGVGYLLTRAAASGERVLPSEIPPLVRPILA